jgi:hypothetical protein
MPQAPKDKRVCRWISESKAFSDFAIYTGPTQSQDHIKPLHWYVACRLVVEGGFHPDEITPRPPFMVKRSRGANLLHHEATSATGGEAIILGGMKTKNVDVVVNKQGLGPVLAVSCKGMTGALRNLTNRMEETIGECTNLHITYPALVFGFLFVMRANRMVEDAVAITAPDNAPPARQLAANDIAIASGGEPVEAIIRYHTALRELTGRRGIRNDMSRYEAVALSLIDMSDAKLGKSLKEFPPMDSPLRIEQFFKTMYLRYDERFVFSAPDLKSRTLRLQWSPDSPALKEGICEGLNYELRLSSESEEPSSKLELE